jgi:hypothetical protein
VIRERFGSLGSILHLLALTWAAAIASFPLSDNSFLTHLATGRIILDEGRVPTRDPYTFTALGEPWTVQSWLASVAYAGSERLGGEVGLRALILVVFLIAATLLWRLTAAAPTVIGRLVLTSLGLLVATGLWGERPYMIGVIGLSVVWLALEGRVNPWLLVPLLWVWTNAHGSFPLAIALCLAVLVGSAIDRRVDEAASSGTDHELRVTGAVVLGVLLGVIGPLGFGVLTFPFSALTRSEVFAEIIEWQPPQYQSAAERTFLVLVVVTMLLLVGRRSWRLGLPAVGFAAMAIYAQRNVVMAAVVLIAVAAHCMPPAGSLRSADRPRLGAALAGVTAGLAALVAAVALVSPVAGFGGYPTRALAFVEASALEGRMATQMPAGNLLGVLDGPQGAVFIDDRVDMFSPAVLRDFFLLDRGRVAWEQVLDYYKIETVVWSRESPLSAHLASSWQWRTEFSDAAWAISRKRSS